MKRLMLGRFIACAVLASLLACASPMESAGPGGSIADGKADGIGGASTDRVPLNVGRWFDTQGGARSFAFVLEDEASIEIDVSPVPANVGASVELYSVDTVTLATTLLSSATREATSFDEESGAASLDRFWIGPGPLAAGRYAVVITPAAPTDRLEATLTVGCSGAGCGAVRRCAFGERTSDLYGYGNRIDEMRDRRTFDALGELEREQAQAIIDAAQRPDVQSVAAVFAQARFGIQLYEVTTSNGERYTSVTADLPETRAAYRSTSAHATFGAFFRAETTERVAVVRESENYACQVEMQFEPLPGCAEAAQDAENLLLGALGDGRLRTWSLGITNGARQRFDFFTERGRDGNLYPQAHAVETILEDDVCRVYLLAGPTSTSPREQRDPEVARSVSPECGASLAETIRAFDARNGWSGEIDPGAIEILSGRSIGQIGRVPVTRTEADTGPEAYTLGITDGCRIGAIRVEGYESLY